MVKFILCEDNGYNAIRTFPSSPVLDNYTFGGWYWDEDLEEPVDKSVELFPDNTNHTKTLTAYAKWIPSKSSKVEMTFNPMGGSKVNKLTIDYNGTLDVFPQSEREGYVLDGWYTSPGADGEKATPDMHWQSDKTLFARWTPKQYTITFDARVTVCPKDSAYLKYWNTICGNGSMSVVCCNNENTHITTQVYDYDSIVVMPDGFPPTRVGYDFQGWDPPVPNIMPAENLICKAQWSVKKYVVTWEGNGGTPSVKATKLEYATDIITLPYAVQDGFSFLGWFTSPNGEKQIHAPVSVEKDVTYYAKWWEIPNEEPAHDDNDDEDEEEVDEKTRSSRIVLCCVATEGSTELINWIHHNLDMGFYRIYIYHCGELREFKQMLNEKPIKGVKIVDLLRIQGENYANTVCAHCFKNYKDKCGWMAFMDSTEYIVPVGQGCDSLTDLFNSNRVKFTEYEAVRLDLVRYTDHVQLAKDFAMGDVSMLLKDKDGVDGPTGDYRCILNCKTKGLAFSGMVPIKNGTNLNMCLPNGDPYAGESDIDTMYVATNPLEPRWRKWKKKRKY